MKKLLISLPFILFCLITGCYDVPFLIYPEKEGVILDELIGKWAREKSDVPTRMTDLYVSREDNSPWYNVDLHEDSGRIWKLKVILHRISDKIIASSTERDGSQPTYSIFRISTPASGKLTFESLDENAPRFNDKNKFIEFLASPAGDSWFVRPTVFNKIS
jgi:hypothetical protein